MKKSQASKLLLLLLIWVTVLSWWLRIFPSFDNPGLIGGYGATHDWGRHHIVETGGTQNIPTGITGVSHRMSIRPDFMTYYLATISIISGAEKFNFSIRLFQSLPNLTYFFPALVSLLFYRHLKSNKRLIDIALIFLTGLFISGVFISFTQNAMLYAGYGICFLTLLIYVMFRILESNINSRWTILFSFFCTVMGGLYHTIALLALLLIPGYYLLEALALRYGGVQLDVTDSGRGKTSIALCLISITIFLTMGMFYSGLIKELTTKLAWLFILTPEKTETLSAAKGSVLVSSLTLSGIIDNISKISKFLLRFIYIIIISSFIYRIIKLNTIDESDLFLSALIIFYPLVFFMYYSYGGFGVGVRRTAAAGTPLIAMLLPYLLVKIGSVKRQKVLRGLMVCIILLSIGTQLPLLVQNDQYTAAEVASVEFAGEKVPQDELIFTEPTIGNSLIYYNQKGISFVRVVYRGWEQKLLRIYFEPNSSETRSGVQSVLRNQLRETSNVGNNDGGTHYVFTTKKLHKQGISLETIKYNRNPGPEFYRSFDKNYNRVYNSGDELLYSTPS